MERVENVFKSKQKGGISQRHVACRAFAKLLANFERFRIIRSPYTFGQRSNIAKVPAIIISEVFAFENEPRASVRPLVTLH